MRAPFCISLQPPINYNSNLNMRKTHRDVLPTTHIEN